MLTLSLPSGRGLQDPLELETGQGVCAAWCRPEGQVLCAAQHSTSLHLLKWTAVSIQMASIWDCCANSTSRCSKTLLCSLSLWQPIIPEYHMASWHKCYTVSCMIFDSATKSHMEPSREKILNIVDFFQDHLKFFSGE